MVPFSFSDEEMLVAGGRAIYWPRERALLVSDLHLEKSSFFAGSGQMLPPYDSRETLERVALAIRETGARRVFALGDNFHDADGANRLEAHAAGMLSALVRATEWVWIAGNHDAPPGGETVAEMKVGRVILRHEAASGETAPEISGHFHPRLTIRARGRRIARPCVVRSGGGGGAARLVLPAFGALTGGMDASDPAIVSTLQPADAIDALVPTAERLVEYPLWRAAA